MDTSLAPTLGQQVDVARIVRRQLAPHLLPTPVTVEAAAELETLLHRTACEMLEQVEPDMFAWASTLHRLSRPVPEGFGVDPKTIAAAVRRGAADMANRWQQTCAGCRQPVPYTLNSLGLCDGCMHTSDVTA